MSNVRPHQPLLKQLSKALRSTVTHGKEVMSEQIITTVKKIWKDLFFDQRGLNLLAAACCAAWAVAIIIAVRAALQTGTFDILQYSLGISVLLVGYGAAAGSRARTNGRIGRLEARIAELEKSRGSV